MISATTYTLEVRRAPRHSPSENFKTFRGHGEYLESRQVQQKERPLIYLKKKMWGPCVRYSARHFLRSSALGWQELPWSAEVGKLGKQDARRRAGSLIPPWPPKQDSSSPAGPGGPGTWTSLALHLSWEAELSGG